MKWPTVKLKSVTSKVGSGATPKGGEAVYNNAGIPLIRSMNVHFDGFRRNGLVYIDEHEASLLNHVEIQRDDVLFNITGASIGRVTTAPDDMVGARVNQHVCILRPTDKLRPQFLSYYMRSPDQQALVGSNQIGGTRQAVTKEMLLNWEISLPPLGEQERIVKLLDEADELRKLRAQAARRTADLIPALFHDMFGPDAPGSATWQTATVAELAAAHEGSIRTGPFGSDLRHAEFVEEGVPVLGIDNVVENEFRWTKSRCIPEAKFEEMKRFVVFPGDVLVTIMGTVGRCSIAPEELPVCISTKHLCTVTLDRAKAHPRFIWGSFLHDASVKQQTRLVGKGAIMEGWNSTIIKRLRLQVPPLPLQEEFAARVSEIRAMQAEQAASHRRLDDLFQSMLHRAFQGEL